MVDVLEYDCWSDFSDLCSTLSEGDRYIDYGVLAVDGDRHPGPGNPRRYLPGSRADVLAYQKLTDIAGPGPGSGSGFGRIFGRAVAAWRDRGRPAGWLGLRDGQPAVWRSADAVAADLAEGFALIAARVPVREDVR